MNKVLFGIKNVYIAKLIENDGVISYEAPFPVPGATGFTPDPQGEETLFYADNKIYFRDTSNQGYTGTVNVALLPEKFMIDIMGRTKDANGAIVENSEDKQSRFAFIFEADGDEKNRRFVYWDCTASRSTREYKTKEKNADPATEGLPITIAPRSTDNAIGAYLEKTTDNTQAYNSFFTEVYEPVAGV